MSFLNAFILTLILIFSSWIYMKMATKFGIIDKPNDRSSHSNPTIRGGGIIFVIAIVLFFFLNNFEYPFFFGGLLLIAIVSFLDDMYTLSSLLRLIVQLIAVSFTIYNVIFLDEALIIFLVTLVFATGLLNIYNFMDGVNGITGLYSIAVLLPLLYLNYLNPFVNHQLLILCLIALIIFGFYNFRKSAKCFAGDVGSISIGLTLIFCVALLIEKEYNFGYILFFLIYLIDGGITILERLVRRENIFSPHRNHLYQVLVDRKRYSHLKVSLGYSFVQLLISALIIWKQDWYVLLGIIAIPSIYYISLKRKVLKIPA